MRKVKPKKLKLKRNRAAPIEEKTFNEGDWVDDYYRGREIPFTELPNYVDKLVVIDYSTEAHPWYKVCRINSVKCDDNNLFDDYVTFLDGSKRGGGLGRISRMFFEDTEAHPAYIWELNAKGGPNK